MNDIIITTNHESRITHYGLFHTATGFHSV